MNKPKLYLPKDHHSVADWDMAETHWAIVTDQYVSPPSSIKRAHTVSAYDYQLCKHAGTIKLPEGRLISYFRHQSATYHFIFLFRNTAVAGTSDRENCYLARLTSTLDKWYLYEYLNNVETRRWDEPFTSVPVDAWHKYRISWWLAWGVLQVRLERWVDPNWVQQGLDISIIDPLFGDEDVQRCGVGGRYGTSGRHLWIDDTEIWEYA